jgi:hypothetical protein
MEMWPLVVEMASAVHSKEVMGQIETAGPQTHRLEPEEWSLPLDQPHSLGRGRGLEQCFLLSFCLLSLFLLASNFPYWRDGTGAWVAVADGVSRQENDRRATLPPVLNTTTLTQLPIVSQSRMRETAGPEGA